jgi:hypothetical protein
VARQLAVTLIVPAAALLLARVPLPGLDGNVVERIIAAGGRGAFDVTLLGILALELHPLISASLGVELLALVVPRWRAWRVGGYSEREHLWAHVKLLALVLTLAQAFFMVRWIQRTSEVFPAFLGALDPFHGDTLMFIAQMLSLVGGVFLLTWLARLIDRYGAGNGISVLIAGFTVVPVGGPLVASVRHLLDNGERNLLPLALAAAAVLAVTRLTGGHGLRPGRALLDSHMLPTPASGVKPIATAFALLELPRFLARVGIWTVPEALQRETWILRGLELAFTALSCVLYTWVFNRPKVVGGAWLRAGLPEVDPEQTRARVRAAVARALSAALVTCCGLLAIDWFCDDDHLEINLIGVMLIACVAADVVGELRFRGRHGPLAGAWPVHRLYVLTPLLRALDAAGIPAFPRARHYRTLWNFFAPFAPVEILVPAGDVGRAEAILRPLAADPPAPVEAEGAGTAA